MVDLPKNYNILFTILPICCINYQKYTNQYNTSELQDEKADYNMSFATNGFLFHLCGNELQVYVKLQIPDKLEQRFSIKNGEFK